MNILVYNVYYCDYCDLLKTFIFLCTYLRRAQGEEVVSEEGEGWGTSANTFFSE